MSLSNVVVAIAKNWKGVWFMEPSTGIVQSKAFIAIVMVSERDAEIGGEWYPFLQQGWVLLEEYFEHINPDGKLAIISSNGTTYVFYYDDLPDRFIVVETLKGELNPNESLKDVLRVYFIWIRLQYVAIFELIALASYGIDNLRVAERPKLIEIIDDDTLTYTKSEFIDKIDNEQERETVIRMLSEVLSW